MKTALTDFINTNAKNSQMKHCLCLRYAMIYRSGWKNQLKVEIDLSKYATTKQSLVSTLYIYLRCPK